MLQGLGSRKGSPCQKIDPTPGSHNPSTQQLLDLPDAAFVHTIDGAFQYEAPSPPAKREPANKSQAPTPQIAVSVGYVGDYRRALQEFKANKKLGDSLFQTSLHTPNSTT